MFKKFIPFWAFLTLFKFGSGLHYTLLPALGERVLPVWIVGLLIGGLAFLQVILDVPAGHLLDKFGYKRLLGITTIIFIVGASFLMFGLTPLTFVLTLIGSALGWLFFSPGIQAYIIHNSTEDMVGRLLSKKDVFASLGIVLASMVVIFAVSFEAQLIGVIVMIILALAYGAIASSPNDLNNHEAKGHAKRRSVLKKGFLSEAYKTIMRLRPVSIMLILAGLSASIFYGIIWFTVPLLIAHAAETGLNGGVLALGLGVFDFAIVALGFILGKLVDAYDKKMLILLGLLIFSVAGILIGFNFGILFLFLGFFATTGDELTTLSLWAWLYNIDKKHESYGLISGIIVLFEDLGWTIGPILAGFLYYFIGPEWTIASGGFLILANLALYLLFLRHPSPEAALPHPRKPHRARHRD